MKKFFGLLAVGLAVTAYADGVQFLTTMPSPLGSFSVLEVVQSENPTPFTSSVLFGTELSTGGEIDLIGGGNYTGNIVALGGGTALTSGTKNLNLDTITLNSGGVLIGRKLLTQLMKTANGTRTQLKATNLYLYDTTVKGASANALFVNEVDTVFSNSTSGSGTACWTNKYRKNRSGVVQETYQKQFLIGGCN